MIILSIIKYVTMGHTLVISSLKWREQVSPGFLWWVYSVICWFFSEWSDWLIQYAAAAKSHQSCPTPCDSIARSPPGFRPWDSPGKNTGVGCHLLLYCMEAKSESEVTQSCPTLLDSLDCSPLNVILRGSTGNGSINW